MNPACGIEINGKFLAAQMTGVHRVADELVKQLAGHSDELIDLFGGPVLLRAPRNAVTDHLAYGLAFNAASILAGQPWEQFELPARSRSKVLLNFCNLAPMASGNSITMIHDAQVFSTPESYSKAFVQFYRTVQPILGRRALRVLTVSHYSARELTRWNVAPLKRIRVIHNGVDHVRAVPADPTIVARLGLSSGRYVLALSSTHAHKNIATLLAAFSAPELAGIRLVLFGAPSSADLTAAGLVVPDGVICAGRLSDGELRALMDSALCFAMPSLTEGFGLPPLEAMLVGCPAVVSTTGALPEVCGDAALYAAPNDPAAWVQAICTLADDPATRGKYAARGIAQASLFTWHNAGNALMAVLREVAAERRAPNAGSRA